MSDLRLGPLPWFRKLVVESSYADWTWAVPARMKNISPCDIRRNHFKEEPPPSVASSDAHTRWKWFCRGER